MAGILKKTKRNTDLSGHSNGKPVQDIHSPTNGKVPKEETKTISPLRVSLAILRSVQKEKQGRTKVGIRTGLGTGIVAAIETSEMPLNQHLSRLVKRKLMIGKDRVIKGSHRFTYTLTPAGKLLVEEAEGLKLTSPKLCNLKWRIDEHLKAIQSLGKSIEEAKLERLRHRHELGTALREVKESMPHGFWQMWVEDNVKSMKLGHVEAHMRYAAKSAFTQNLKEEQEKWNKETRNANRPNKTAAAAGNGNNSGNTNQPSTTSEQGPSEVQQQSTNEPEEQATATQEQTTVDGDDTTAEDREAEAQGETKDKDQDDNENQEEGGTQQQSTTKDKGVGNDHEETPILELCVNKRFFKKVKAWIAVAKKRFDVTADSEAIFRLLEAGMEHISDLGIKGKRKETSHA